MLTITVPKQEMWDEIKEEFVYQDEVTLHLEHSLVAISKWESAWHKRFFSNEEKSDEEIVDYIKCMTLDEDIPSDVYYRISDENFKEINDYLGDPMTATVLPKTRDTGKKENLSAELIYYYMFSCGIPEECSRWHIARLVTLLGVYGVKNAPKKRRSRADLTASHRAINEANRRKFNTKG